MFFSRFSFELNPNRVDKRKKNDAHNKKPNEKRKRPIVLLGIQQRIDRSRERERQTIMIDVQLRSLELIFFSLEQIPTRSFWVILRLVFFFFAIEFMYAIETALTVPILMSLKVEEK